MQFWKWLIPFVVFMTTTSYSSALSLQQMVKQTKNQTEHLASESLLADVTGYQQGHFENSSKAQGQHRNNPEFRAPLDSLSKSFMKVKKDKRRQSKMPQKQPGQKGSVEQIITGESSHFKILRPGDKCQPADKAESIPVQQPNTKPKSPTDISTTFERNSTDHIRTRVSKKRGQSGTFGLPIDRIGLGHLPHGTG